MYFSVIHNVLGRTFCTIQYCLNCILLFSVLIGVLSIKHCSLYYVISYSAHYSLPCSLLYIVYISLSCDIPCNALNCEL